MSSSRALILSLLLVTPAGLFISAASLRAQDPNYILTHTDVAGFPGDVVSAQVLLDNNGGDLRGWSYGFCHAVAQASILSVTSGATTSTVLAGGPPDFESLDIYFQGVTHGVVICFSGCGVLPVGTGYQILDLQYTIIGNPGELAQACFCDTLGSPLVETIVVDPLGSAIIPTQNCATVQVLVPPPAPVTGLTCTPTPLTCSCDLVLNWTNGEIYDTINIYRDGILHSTVAGAATTATIVSEAGLHEYCVEPVRLAVAAPQVCCTGDCPPVSVPATAVASLTCTVDVATCVASVSWVNTSSYSQLLVFRDGLIVSILPGTLTTTTVLLGGTGPHQICIEGTTVCGDAIPPACCAADCIPTPIQFQRADMNADGGVNIADAIGLLDFIFSSGIAVDCQDALDANDDGTVDISDPVYALAYLFDGGPTPPSPFLVCGDDVTADALDCVDFPLCP